MTASERFMQRVRDERTKRGLPPTIQAPHVYRLLSACVDAQREQARANLDDQAESTRSD